MMISVLLGQKPVWFGRPTLHRVVNNSPRYRVSVAFFYESNFDAAVEPVEFCYQKVVYGEDLVQKVLTNFVRYQPDHREDR
ncbi:hypothetical protein ZWY2020_001491 [Hordeum vulgare]|nr:hypothetical protein ZWY2020_034419 [Hordeum vulgare]KAI4970577.1 hypothetical protein ZWY2020_001491 [Hordeum vulgare]